ncbi:NAD(P)/FAD-dependent oxidoreductase [Actinocrispum wychmicini]|uniref:Glycine/D-amino acid oxidase-like deaminating enzyme n=1 Tax=Actinocrispum wychmicini TaxID=1213861 RepID=A0A4V2S877_9PSEU|nr:FAD-dependent oxidoreductase [Actinocrispum wychmicini]TCO62740.1 glycine/D-amino acid oxidase-like deaminating enzyme [Actinocrispum wychmicini]
MSLTESDKRPYDVVVVGNGALGLSLGLTLARRKVRVAVLGEPHRPWAASTAAGAMNGCFGEVTTTLVASDHGRYKLDMDVQARKMWPEWSKQLADETGQPNVQTADGTVVHLNTVGSPGIDEGNYAAIRTQLDKYEEPYEDIDPADVEWMVAHASQRSLKAFFIPGEHAVDSHRLLDQLQQSYLLAGGVLIAESALRLEYADGQIQGVSLTSGETVSAKDVVLAAGVRSQDLLDTVPDIARRVPRLVSGYGVSALIDTEDNTSPKSVIRTPNRAFACGLHIVPRGDGKVYVGATNIITPEPQDTPVLRDVQFLLDCAHRQVRTNLWNSGLSRLQVGNRPVSLDAFPLLGQTEGLAGLWMMTGTYRDGLHLSPLLAKEMAARILGEEPQLELERFRPVRAPIQPMTREEAVDQAVTHMLATGWEYNWQVTVDWPVIVEYNMRPSYTKWAEDFDPQFVPPPELLAASRIHPSLVKMLRDYYEASRTGV